MALGLVSLLFVGKFFAMFSLLFDVSFFIQMDRAATRGQAFEGRFTWRLAVLFAIGMAHHLVYRGDILASYAVMGLVLLLCSASATAGCWRQPSPCWLARHG